MDSYHCHITRVLKLQGCVGVNALVADLAEVLMVQPHVVAQYFQPFIDEEIADIRGKGVDGGCEFAIIVNGCEVQVTLQATEAEIINPLHCTQDAAKQRSTKPPSSSSLIQSLSRSLRPHSRLRPIDVEEDSDSVSSIPSPSTLRTATIQTVEGGTVLISYVNSVDAAEFPDNWKFRECHFEVNSTQERVCHCKSLYECRESKWCSCAKRNAQGTNASFYVGVGTAKRVTSGSGISHIAECSARCTCNKDTCGLSFLTGGFDACVSRSFQALRSHRHTWAITSRAPIPSGEFVVEVTGERVDSVPTEDLFTVEVEGQRGINTQNVGNLSRFLTHSCAPLLRVVRVTCGEQVRVLLFANRAIAPGVALTANLRHLWMKQDGLKCDCGAFSCKGILTL